MKYKLLIISALCYVLAIACKGPMPEFPYDWRCNYVINGTIFGIDSVLLENISIKMYEVTTDLPPKTILRDSCVSDINGFYEVKNINVIPYISTTYELHLSDLYPQTHNTLYKDTVITVLFINEIFIDGDGDKFLGDTFWKLDISY